ncbi:potassium channel family protein [Streptomyces sp. NBC_00080]|uniref:potassium channel family protein n=1 Tax=Streptomyces sp. NBC_00080 TaxID=2975645 RepID=UPI00324DBE20
MPEAFSFSGTLKPSEHSGPVDALYLSLVTVATLGLGDIAPSADWLRIGEDHTGRALAGLLPVEDHLYRHALADLDQVGAVAATHRHLHPPHPVLQPGGTGAARAEEVPAQRRDQGARDQDDDDFGAPMGCSPPFSVRFPACTGYPCLVGAQWPAGPGPFGPRPPRPTAEQCR